MVEEALAATLPDPSSSWAVLIGCSGYDHFEDLPAVANNLMTLTEFFISPRGWALPPGQCVTISDPRTPAEVVNPLRAAADRARDALFVYYAGHGVLDDELRFHVSLTGSAGDEPWTCLSYEWIRKALARARAPRRVAVLDSCFSGKVHLGLMSRPSDAVRASTSAQGTVVLTSARDDRVSLAPPGERYTAFTGELLTVMTEGIPGGPDLITVDSAYEHVKRSLASRGMPRPDRTGSDTAGALVLAANAAADLPSTGPVAAVASFRDTMRRLARRTGPATVPESARRPGSVPESGADSGADSGAESDSASAPEPAGPFPGDVLRGRYEVRSCLGVGSMSRVYAAHDRILGRTVAIKISSGPLELGDVAHGEAQVVAGLNHPSIATVYDAWRARGTDCIVMEHINGRDLARLRLRTPLSPAECAAMAYEFLGALAYAHDAGVVHCDVKPANIMITVEGRVKILDFGIAGRVADEHPGIHADRFVGTPQFAPPESFAGAPPDVRRDVYASGVTLFFLLTGHMPFDSDDAVVDFVDRGESLLLPPQTRTSHVPRPSSRASGVSPGLDALVMRAMHPDPEQRFQTATRMRAALASHPRLPDRRRPLGRPTTADTVG
ncbi:protein kinase [Streptomyces sp. NPDC002467]|uniref:caspase, EACC1-associated type n=1 Tax=Streptomyces sp. NPDC002467 TaxID=3364647 RepID=UPI00368E2FF6